MEEYILATSVGHHGKAIDLVSPKGSAAAVPLAAKATGLTQCQATAIAVGGRYEGVKLWLFY